MNTTYLLFAVYLYCDSTDTLRSCDPMILWNNIFDDWTIDFDGLLRYKPNYDSGIGERHRIPIKKM